MMQQYFDLKATCQDALLFFRLGDFYEMFMDDAIATSQALDITLTGRDAGDAGRVPMCGVPFHAAEQYIARLVEQGYRVAIADQTEDPKSAKGLVRREIVRLITPGTWMVDGKPDNRFLACVVEHQSVFGVAATDVSTGEFWFDHVADDLGLQEWFARWRPVEVLLTADPLPWLAEWAKSHQACLTAHAPVDHADARDDALFAHFGRHVLDACGLLAAPVVAAVACRTLLQYLRETQKSSLPHIQAPRRMRDPHTLFLDETARRNLELVETTRQRQRQGSLYGLLNETKTAMGARLLRHWILQPLANEAGIEGRLDAVEELVGDLFLRESVRDCLQPVYDLDRLLARVSLGSANARDILALGRSLQVVPALLDTLQACRSALLRSVVAGAPDCRSLAADIVDTLVDQPPVSVRDGGMIRDGIDPVLDELKAANLDGKTWIAALEQRERERTGIKSLKVGFNKVFGYYLEVSKANLHLVPETYERRQTLASVERFVLPEMKQQEALILQAQERQTEREFELFTALRDRVLDRMVDIQRLSERVALVDVLQSLGVVAVRERFARPTITAERGVYVEAGRHPVVEAAHPGEFVPNHVALTPVRHLLLITGPNMAGKSTYMRQIALIVLLAHMGSFVPAKSATIGLVDRIFTRIGASDDLAAGRSTFMVEMVELAEILREATDRSLVLLDEIGRGTSTYDGLSIAEAVVEALTTPGRTPLTLFATHYHELTGTAASLAGAANLSVLVEEDGHEIRFLHTVVDRPADKSYGIQVARLAGLPAPVIERATALLADRERVAYGAVAGLTETAAAMDDTARDVAGVEAGASDGLAVVTQAPVPQPSLALSKLADVDVNRLTPLDAMNVLAELVRAAKGELEWA